MHTNSDIIKVAIATLGTVAIAIMIIIFCLPLVGYTPSRTISVNLSNPSEVSSITTTPTFDIDEIWDDDADQTEIASTDFTLDTELTTPDPMRDVFLKPGLISYSLLYNEGDTLSPKAADQTLEMAYRGIKCNPEKTYTWAGGTTEYELFYQRPALLTQLLEWVIYDYPILSAYRTGNDNVSVLVDADGHYMLKSDMSLTGYDMRSLYDEIEARAQSIYDTSLAESDGTTLGFIYAVYRNICENARYSDGIDDTWHANDIYGALIEGESKCYGLSCAFKYVLDKQDIPNFIAYGSGNGIPHAWNIIWIDGQWQACDLTAGCEVLAMSGVSSSYEVANFIFYQACLIPQEEYFATCNVTMEERCYALEDAWLATQQ